MRSLGPAVFVLLSCLAVLISAGPQICSISQPAESNDAFSLVNSEKSTCVSAHKGNGGKLPIKGIGAIIRPHWKATYHEFVLHDHMYKAAHVPEPARAQVIFVFSEPVLITHVEVVQHRNGIQYMEGFVKSLTKGSQWKSIGTARSTTRGERHSDHMKFPHPKKGAVLKLVVRRTPLSHGWASYRWFPRTSKGRVPAGNGHFCSRYTNFCAATKKDSPLTYPGVCAVGTDVASVDAGDFLHQWQKPDFPERRNFCSSANRHGIMPKHHRGMANLLNPRNFMRTFTFHDHRYKTDYVPARGKATFIFSRVLRIKSLAIYQHSNGIQQVEGFMCMSWNCKWKSLGVATSSHGWRYPEKRRAEFKFPRTGSGDTLKIVIRRLGLQRGGYATYSWIPRQANGELVYRASTRRQGCVRRVKHTDLCTCGPMQTTAICAVGAPQGKMDAGCKARSGYCSHVKGGYLRTHDIGGLANVNEYHLNGFGLHDHHRIANHIPDPTRSNVKYVFSSKQRILGLFVVQHANGISQIEGYVGDTSLPNSWTSLGVAKSTRNHPWPEKYHDYFRFPHGMTVKKTGNVLKIVIRRTGLANAGYAIYRIVPMNADGIISTGTYPARDGCPTNFNACAQWPFTKKYPRFPKRKTRMCPRLKGQKRNLKSHIDPNPEDWSSPHDWKPQSSDQASVTCKGSRRKGEICRFNCDCLQGGWVRRGNTYMPHFGGKINGRRYAYKTLAAAKKSCFELDKTTCGGVTKNRGWYELRKGPSVRRSGTREITWVRPPVTETHGGSICLNGRCAAKAAASGAGRWCQRHGDCRSFEGVRQGCFYNRCGFMNTFPGSFCYHNSHCKSKKCKSGFCA